MSFLVHQNLISGGNQWHQHARMMSNSAIARIILVQKLTSVVFIIRDTVQCCEVL